MKIILFANTEWYLFNFRLSLAKALQSQGHEVLLISPPGEFGARLQAEGFRWQALPMDRRSLNPLQELRLLAHLCQLYRRERPALAHHFTIKCVVYGSIAALLARVPARVNAVAGMGYVFTNNALKARLLRPLVRALMRLVLNGRGARLILQNNDDVAAFAQAGLARPELVRLVKGSGVDLTRFTPHAQPVQDDQEGQVGKDTQPTRVLLAARLLWDKGIAEYVEAARLLRAQGLTIRFLLAGAPDPGNPAAIPQATLDGWAAAGLVELLGQVSDMAALFASVDIAVLPSYREGLPKSLIEAAACALPLVTTDAPGCREVVTHEVDGLIVPVKNGQALAAAIRRLHLDPAWARRLGLAARARALQEFDERIVIRQTLAVYAELLE
ncbi:glycosyltransferase family 4 protein [Polaromonas sp.]|uniref:glycosyltransferase family 4 protein n=1 Tax=Polaromonas sp. TaxID=1869339 RepID=UPI00286BE9B6|nr:glycosyltransferase family 4 protein [Polaromonas sp.]